MKYLLFYHSQWGGKNCPSSRLLFRHQYQTRKINILNLERHRLEFYYKTLSCIGQNYKTIYLKTFNTKFFKLKFKIKDFIIEKSLYPSRSFWNSGILAGMVRTIHSFTWPCLCYLYLFKPEVLYLFLTTYPLLKNQTF